MKVNPCLRLRKANSASADAFGDYLLTKKSKIFVAIKSVGTIIHRKMRSEIVGSPF